MGAPTPYLGCLESHALGVTMRYARIKEHSDDYSVAHLCRTMHVSKSGFYRWLSSEPSPRNVRTASIRAAVMEVYQQSNGIYGSHKIAEKLKSDENLETACRNTVAKAMKDLDIKSRVSRKLNPPRRSMIQARNPRQTFWLKTSKPEMKIRKIVERVATDAPAYRVICMFMIYRIIPCGTNTDSTSN